VRNTFTGKRFEVLPVVDTKISIFSNDMPYRCTRVSIGTCCLRLHSEDGSNRFLRNFRPITEDSSSLTFLGIPTISSVRVLLNVTPCTPVEVPAARGLENDCAAEGQQ
jgi:hypothetical protein